MAGRGTGFPPLFDVQLNYRDLMPRKSPRRDKDGVPAPRQRRRPRICGKPNPRSPRNATAFNRVDSDPCLVERWPNLYLYKSNCVGAPCHDVDLAAPGAVAAGQNAIALEAQKESRQPL